MSRDDGFLIADVDTGYFTDAKMGNLWRALGDEALMARAVCLHDATLLASWRQGDRVDVTEAAPLWLAPDAKLVAALKTAKLLDRTGKIPASSWKVWFGVAFARRESRRATGRLGGLASTALREGRVSISATVERPSTGPRPTPKERSTKRASNAQPTVNPSDRPSVRPTGSANARAPGREAGTWFDEDDPSDGLPSVVAWLARERSASVPPGHGEVELARLVDQHGAARVIEALAAQDPTMKDGRQYVFGAMKTLNPLPAKAPVEEPWERDVRETRERIEAKREAARRSGQAGQTP